MKPVELSRPITLYWDLSPAPQIPLDSLAICDHVLSLHPLQILLQDNASSLSKGCISILEILKGAPIAVTLAAPAPAICSAAELLRGQSLQGLFISATGTAELDDEIPAVQSAYGSTPGISFEVTSSNWRKLPELMMTAARHSVSEISLPMHRFNHGTPLILTSQEQEELQLLLAKIDRAGLNLTIHDPFLWRAFNPAVPFPGRGCQAGNTMAFIAPDGTVYPCPSLPIPLGAVPGSPLVALVTGQAKKDLRIPLASLPDECSDCIDVDGCRGGCRGRSVMVLNSPWKADPACRQLAVERGRP